MLRHPSSTKQDSLSRQNTTSLPASSKKRLQRILHRGQIFLCLSFALLTFTINLFFFAKLNAGRDEIQSNVSDAPVLDVDIGDGHFIEHLNRRRGRNSGIHGVQLYNDTRYHHRYHDGLTGSGIVVEEGWKSSSQGSRVRRNKVKNTSYEQTIDVKEQRLQSPSHYHPKVICFYSNTCNDLIFKGIDRFRRSNSDSMDSIPILRSRHIATPFPDQELGDLDMYNSLEDHASNEGDEEDEQVDDYIASNDTSDTASCRHSRSIESRTTTHPTCNDIHSLGFDAQMLIQDNSSRAESVDFLAIGGANSVWKTTSHYNGEHVILKTSKYLKAFDPDRLSLYVLDAMIAGNEGNPQLFSLLQSESAVSKASSPSSTSSWNHIMPIYGHCHLASIAPVASGTLKEYVTTYPEHNHGQLIEPLDKLRLALQVARGLHQIQMYQHGKPTFAHLDLNPSQFLVFEPHHGSNLPILQINDFNRGRFLHWDNQNNTCPFQFDGCEKNTRGGRWHAPDRFIGCLDVNEKIDTFTLGGVFFFLLTDGKAPFWNIRKFGDHIKDGELPPIPKSVADAIGDHPAFDALSEMVARCRALRIEDRPSSLGVVRMLEDRLSKIELGLRS